MAERENDARGWLDRVLDPGWALLFEDVVSTDPLGFPGYAAQLDKARTTTGSTESVLVASGALGGRQVVALSFEFGFLGGSMGMAAGERIRRAFELAASTPCPVIALCASGGARMQEGMHALATMPGTILPREALGRAGQPFIAYLRNPSTGGVFASFVQSADLMWGAPGATIGFAGPRVVEAFTGSAPTDSHTAETARRDGLIDEIVSPDDLRARTLAVLDGDGSALLSRGANDTDGISAELKRVGSRHAVVISTDPERMITPDGYARARMAIATAARLSLPIVTLIDTPGADPRSPSESGAIARAIAGAFDALLRAPVPTVAVVTGKGSSGGALSLAACDRVIFQPHAWFSVIAPAGAAAILRRDDVDQVARDLKLDEHVFPRAPGEPGPFVDDDPDPLAIAGRALDGLTGPTPERTARWGAGAS